MRGSIVKKGKKYCIVIYMGRDKNGKKKQKWYSGFNTKKEAERELMKLLNDIENNNYMDITKMKVRDYLLEWHNTYVAANLKETTIEGYKMHIERYINSRIGDIELQKLKPFHIQSMYTDLLNNGRFGKDGGLSNRTVLQTHRILRKALSYAYKMQIINKNVADLVQPPKKKTYQAKFLTESEIPSFINAFKDTELYLPVVLAIGLGLRRGEILGLRWQDVDFEHSLISIKQSLLRVKKTNIFSTPKTDSSRRTIVASENIMKLLRITQTEINKNKEFFDDAYSSYDLVVCRVDGSPITPNALTPRFNSLLHKKNLPILRFHDLRHTNATLMLKNNIPAKIASQRLGHSSIAITLDLYSHVVNEMQEEAAKKINKVL